ncbi:hypothetical protein [Algibacter agarivorans]|uniref:hypothetical protein n=1 Tax=Algibacter agarivorans TaxID=1109741 RepID=UPI0031E59BCC
MPSSFLAATSSSLSLAAAASAATSASVFPIPNTLAPAFLKNKSSHIKNPQKKRNRLKLSTLNDFYTK